MSRSLRFRLGLTLTAALPALGAAQRAPTLTVRAENALAVARNDETVTVPWTTVRRALPKRRRAACA